MNWGVKNSDVSGGNYYMNSNTVSESKIQESVYYKNKSDENTHNRP